MMTAGDPPDCATSRDLLVCFSHLRWEFVFQRPQHLLSRAALLYDVVYWEEPERGAVAGQAPTLKVVATPEGVTVVRPILPPDLSEAEIDSLQSTLLDGYLASRQSQVAVAWFYTPMAMGFAGHIEGESVIYDCMDELTLFKGASPRLLLLERRLLRRANLVFTGGRSLQRAKQGLHKHVHCFPSAVDRAHFVRARHPKIEVEPADQVGIAHPRVGFFGVLDERLDADLLAQVAALRPGWQFVLIGPTAKIQAADLPQADNIHWLGAKTYAELPDYLAGWDAGLMPFAINEATRFISPTKTPEFLAAGVRLVSTPVTDVVDVWGQLGLVDVAADAPGLVAALDNALRTPREPWLRRVDAALSGISWDDTFTRMHALIDRTATVTAAGGQSVQPLHGARTAKAQTYDWLVVGAGFAGSVLARNLAEQRGERVLVIDKREHVAGNAFDCLDDAGLLIHRYGPHIFHTNAQSVVDFLSRFTEWRPYEHRVLAEVDGQQVPMPINLDTINRLYKLDLTSDQLEGWFAERAEPVADIRTSEDVVVSRVGRELYEKFFRGYTRKQWGLDPSQLSRIVTARVPVRTDRDDRYFTDTFQAMPRDGYTAMFHRLLDYPNITVRVGLDYATARHRFAFRNMVWTGPMDEFFGFAHGRLPYRSLRFVHETLAQPRFQTVGVVNYPQTQEYTRITEYKHLTGQAHPQTSISYEYPSDQGDPYYPIPRPENAAMFERYRAMADATPDTWFVGRLATYQYMNMDQVVGQALATFRRIQAALPLTRRQGVVGATAGD